MNAQAELLAVLAQARIPLDAIRCAELRREIENPDTESSDFYIMVTISLSLGYSPEEAETFWKSLDVEYDHGFGSQNLFGTVWLTESRWLERGEYDGSEWWDLRVYPEIPESLKGKKNP